MLMTMEERPPVRMEGQGEGDLEGVDGHHASSTPQCRMIACPRAERIGQSAVSPGKHAGAAVGRRGRARAREGEEGGSGGVQGHRAPSPLKLDPPRTLPDARTPTPMSFREGLGAPGPQFHVNCRGSPPSSALPAAVRPPSEDCHRAVLVNSSQLINRVFLHQC